MALQDTEMQHMKVSVRILQEDNKRLKETLESNNYESQVQTRWGFFILYEVAF